jgi:hypothetical protein
MVAVIIPTRAHDLSHQKNMVLDLVLGAGQLQQSKLFSSDGIIALSECS